MNEKELDELLAEVQAEELGLAPKTYNEEQSRYGKCPAIWRYRQAADNNTWTAPERQHVRHCPYCQKTIAMQWRFGCPEAAVLKNAGFAEAVRLHVEKGECRRCRAVLKRGDGLEGWITGVLALAGGQDDQGGPPPFSFRCKTGEPPLEVTLREKRGELVLRVQSEDRSRAGSKVLVSLRLDDGQVLTCDLELKDEGEYGSLEEANLGRIADLAPKMREFAVSTDWV